MKIFQNTVTFVALLIPLLNIGELILVFVILCSCKNVYLLLYGFVTLALFLVKQKQSIDPVFGNIFAMVFIQFDTLYLINFWKHYYGLDRQTQQIKDNPRRAFGKLFEHFNASGNLRHYLTNRGGKFSTIVFAC